MCALATSNGVRVGGYVLVAALAFVAYRREARRAGDVDGVWPAFWVLTGGLLLVMAVGRAADLGDLAADLGRSEAVDRGWYGSRRGVQAAVVVATGLVWLVSVAVAWWRTPQRRRRYLPMGIAVATLVAFAAVRAVSLHQVDTLLYRRHVADIRIATLTECVLLAIAGIMTAWVPSPPTGRTVQPSSV